MRTTVSLKTLFRSPVRTILTFVLFGVVSFAFIVQVSEYAITKREINNAALLYRGVGTVEIKPPIEQDVRTPFYIVTDQRISAEYTKEEKEFIYSVDSGAETHFRHDEISYQPLTRGQITAISSLPYIAVADTRYMTAGVSDVYLRRFEDRNYWPYTNRIIVEATLEEVRISKQPDSPNDLFLSDTKVLAGHYPHKDVAGQSISVTHRNAPPSIIYIWNTEMITPWDVYGTEYMNTLVPKQRYVFVLRYKPFDDVALISSGNNLVPNFGLADYLTDSWCDAVWSLEGEPENYLGMERFAPLRQLIEITKADDHTFDVVYTECMDTIMRFSEGNMTITEGRTLTRDDSKNDVGVCVINSSIAQAYNLGVGDTMTLNVGAELFEQYRGLGAAAVTWQRFSLPVKTMMLEIVGIYQDIDSAAQQRKNPHWNYSRNTVFVPKSLLPISEGELTEHMFTPAEFSFIIDDAWNTAAFLEAAETMVEELGLHLIFNDKGWLAIQEEYRVAVWRSAINIAVFSVAMVIATWFTVHLFIGRKKKEYAIMRALGLPKNESAYTLVLPLISITTASVLVGVGATWAYMLNTSIPMVVMIGCIAGIFLLVLFVAFLLLWRIGKASLLALLQDGSHGKA